MIIWRRIREGLREPWKPNQESTLDSESPRTARLATFEAVIGDVERERIRAAVLELSLLTPAKSLAALVLDWVVIWSAIAIATSIDSVLAIAISSLIIGSRQHALLLLMHEAAHRRLHPNSRLNEWLSDVFCAFPLFVTTASYRASHFAHHRHTNTDQDPDWMLRRGKRDWQFPKSKVQLSIILLKQISGLSLSDMISKALRFSRPALHRPMRRPSRLKRMAPRVFFYACVALTLSYFGVWIQFLLFWVLPIATSLALFMRIRSIAEHFGLGYEDELSSSRNILPTALERQFLGLHCSHLHLDHHLYPSVPFYNLRRLHEHLLENVVYRSAARKRTSYIFGTDSLWNELVKPSVTG